MAKYDLINEAPGARGFGDVLVDAGQSLRGVDLTDEEVAHIEKFGLLKVVPEDEASKSDLDGLKVDELKALAESEDIDLGDATKKAEIIAAIKLAREEKA